MKILSPLDAVDEVDALADAGAGEFYCGLLEEGWYEKYPVISINRRPAGKGHFRNFADLKEAVTRAHRRGIPVYFTLNEHYYIRDQYRLIETYLQGARQAGVDGLIVSDFGLMAYIRDNGHDIPLHISTGGTVFNWRSAAFFKQLGADNITFPRHLAIEELRDITARMPSIATTVFVLNSRCINVDGFCTFQHGLAGKDIFPMFRNACMLPYDVSVSCTADGGSAVAGTAMSSMVEKQKIWERVHVDDHPCGACAMYEFAEMGISSCKIVGRGNPAARKIKDVVFLKSLLDFLSDVQPLRQDFRKKAQQLYSETYKRTCRRHMCYYPSVLL